jgi:hypothetical protein
MNPGVPPLNILRIMFPGTPDYILIPLNASQVRDYAFGNAVLVT